MSSRHQPALIAVADVPDLTGAGLLSEVEAVLVRRRQCDVDLVMLVQEFARQHDGGGLDPVRADLPGRERSVRLGGAGTPEVAEFAPAVLAARMQLSPYSGRSLVADVLDLTHRLPILNARLVDGEVALGHARFVAAKTRHLAKEDAAKVDAEVATGDWPGPASRPTPRPSRASTPPWRSSRTACASSVTRAHSMPVESRRCC